MNTTFRALIISLGSLLIVSHADAVEYGPGDTTLKEMRAEMRAEADLRAQQEMVKYTAWAVYAALLSGSIGVLTLFALWRSVIQTERTFGHTREEDKATRERDQASIRAYVHADGVAFGQGGRPILSCKNTGSTPAKFFAVGADIKRVPHGKISQSAVMGTYEMKAWPALGGNSELSINIDPTRGEEDLREYTLNGFAASECLVVVGRIIYADIFDRKFETGFAFYTNSKRNGTFGRPVNSLPAYRELSAGEWESISGGTVLAGGKVDSVHLS